MAGISYFWQSIIYGVVTKSVGSVFRVADDWNAPRPVLKNTTIREGVLLALTTVCTTFTQMLFNGTVGRLLSRHPVLKRNELILRGAATAVGIVLAEVVSRVLAPKTQWSQLQNAPGFKDDNDDEDDRIRRPPVTPVVARSPIIPHPPNPHPLKMPLTFSTRFYSGSLHI